MLFQILQTKMMIFGNTTNTTCSVSFKRYNLFYTVQKHEICPIMETVPHENQVSLLGFACISKQDNYFAEPSGLEPGPAGPSDLFSPLLCDHSTTNISICQTF